MVANKPVPGKKYYTVTEANAALPLVRAIVRDLTTLAHELQERAERQRRLQQGQRGNGDMYAEEEEYIREELERGQERMREYIEELNRLGIELKDFYTGLIDFPCWKGNREVYLCWRLGEPEVGWWHEIADGFAGRQKINEPGAARLPGAEAKARTPER
jgi:hypothetical protein